MATGGCGLSRTPVAPGRRLRLGGSRSLALDADLRGDRRLSLARDQSSEQEQARRVRTQPSPGAVEEARAGTPRVRYPADPGPPMARRRHLVVPRTGARVDTTGAVSEAIRAARLS